MAVDEIGSCTFCSMHSGSQYWVFKDTQAMSGYPRPLSDWGLKRTDGTPVDRVDAAFTWAHNGKTYLFSGEDFWRFDESQKDLQPIRQPDPDYPRNKTVWGNMPFPLDDIISWGDGNIACICLNMPHISDTSTDK